MDTNQEPASTFRQSTLPRRRRGHSCSGAHIQFILDMPLHNVVRLLGIKRLVGERRERVNGK